MVKVKVKQGWLEGEELVPSTGEGIYYSFKGIPYATPPVGNLRFKYECTRTFNITPHSHSATATIVKNLFNHYAETLAPVPAQPWEGIRQATEHGSVCPQRDIFTQTILPGSEDCLYLNVYTPKLVVDALLAVMVFIHGGGFKSDSGNVANYGPDYLVNHNVVLVTLNYRLEAFGFLCLDTEDVPGNAGMKDQVLALKWVQENIAKFGGDPNNVTIFGESAGGSSAALHILSPMSKGLFKRSIPMSGVPLSEWSLPFEPRRKAFVLGKQLGLDTKDPNQLLEYLQSVPAEKLIDVNPFLSTYEEVVNNVKLYHFTPCVEKNFNKDHFLTETPENILKNGNLNDVDVMIGYTSLEALIDLPFIEQKLLADYDKYPELIVPKKIYLERPLKKVLELSDLIKEYYFGNKTIKLDTMKEFLVYLTESTYTYDIQRFLNLLPKNERSKRYLYKFSSFSDRNIYGKLGLKYGVEGTSHLDDLMYLFDAKHANLTLVKGTKEYEMVNLACTLFSNFAKFGTPTPDCSLGVSWPEYGDKEFYGEITGNLTVGQHLDADVIAFWRSIYIDAGFEK